MIKPIPEHQIEGSDGLLNPDGWPIRLLRYVLAATFFALALVKLGAVEVSTPLLEPLKLQFATVWATALFQIFVATLLLSRITYVLAAGFILVYSAVLTLMHFSATGSLPLPTLVIMVLALVLIWSDFWRKAEPDGWEGFGGRK